MNPAVDTVRDNGHLFNFYILVADCKMKKEAVLIDIPSKANELSPQRALLDHTFTLSYLAGPNSCRYCCETRCSTLSWANATLRSLNYRSFCALNR